jgi:hypothetical protein
MLGSMTASHLNILHAISHGFTAALTSFMLPPHYQYNAIRRNLRTRTKAVGFLANSAVHFVLEVPSPTPPPPACFCELRLPVAAPHNTQCYPLRTQCYLLFAVVSPVVGMWEGTSMSLLPLPNFAGPDRIEPWGCIPLSTYLIFNVLTQSHLNIPHAISFCFTTALTPFLLPPYYHHNTISRNLRTRTKAAGFLANNAVYFVLEVPSLTRPCALLCELYSTRYYHLIISIKELYLCPKSTYISPKTDLHITQYRPK